MAAIPKSRESLAEVARRAREEVRAKGYAVIENVISPDQVATLRRMFFDWYESIPDLAQLHPTINPHHIFKYHRAGHQPAMWQMRVWVAPFWRAFYDTENVTTSFDGCCFVPLECATRDRLWTHTDQRVDDSRFKCVQGLVALTSNKERTLVVYPGSHKFHAHFGTTVTDPKKRKKSFVRAPQSYLDHLAEAHGIRPLALEIPAGAIALWDSRLLHQNRYGEPGSEQRLVLYSCMRPRDGKKNTDAQRKKRRRYLDARRMTSHWPYPINVNSEQPNLRPGRDGVPRAKKIKYSELAIRALPVTDAQIEALIG